MGDDDNEDCWLIFDFQPSNFFNIGLLAILHEEVLATDQHNSFRSFLLLEARQRRDRRIPSSKGCTFVA